MIFLILFCELVIALVICSICFRAFCLANSGLFCDSLNSQLTLLPSTTTFRFLRLLMNSSESLRRTEVVRSGSKKFQRGQFRFQVRQWFSALAERWLILEKIDLISMVKPSLRFLMTLACVSASAFSTSKLLPFLILFLQLSVISAMILERSSSVASCVCGTSCNFARQVVQQSPTQSFSLPIQNTMQLAEF